MPGLLTDVPGLLLGHTDLGDTGCTAVVSQDMAGMVAGVDVRGGGPGTRETDLLAPHNTVQRVHAVLLSGGSAFGLATGDGAMAALEEAGYGFPVFGEDVPGPRVPIVPAAVIFDLIVGEASNRPTAEDGAAAVRTALAHGTDPRSGSVGAGSAATAGVLRGGFGQASATVGEYTVAAGMVANPMGAVVDKENGRLYGDPGRNAVDTERFNRLELPRPQLNTTIGVVATDAPVTKAQVSRLAMTGHDGIARAVRPAHSPLDGDTIFGLSTAPETGPGVDIETIHELSQAAADVVEAAIVDAVVSAVSGYGITSWNDLV